MREKDQVALTDGGNQLKEERVAKPIMKLDEVEFDDVEGEGELRFGDTRYPIRKHDVIACPTGGPEVAHQIINSGSTTMRYLALSTLVGIEACEYPDSQKVLVVAGERGARNLRKMFRAENTVDYYDRKKPQLPPSPSCASEPNQ